jgi:hypothetical protein
MNRTPVKTMCRISDGILVVCIMLVIACWTALALLMPRAMKIETQNQRNVAAKVWVHTPGYYDYEAFAKENP